MDRLRLRRIVLGCALLLLPPATQAQELRGTFRRDDIELHYRAVGSGAPLVFLSGGPGMEVDYLIPASANVPSFFQHIFLEQRGTGRSRPSVLNAETLSLKLVVDDLEALRVRLNRERLLLLGHSWGGMLAMAYAATYPTRVDRLILIGPGGPTLEFLAWFDDNIRARMRPEDVEARRYWEDALKRGIDADKAALEFVRAITPAYFFDRGKGLAFASQLSDGMVHSQVNSLLMTDLQKGYDLRQQLQTLNRPVLIVQGHQDPVGDKTAEDIHDVIPGSRLRYIARAGHYPWLEEPDEFRRIIAEFLSDWADEPK